MKNLQQLKKDILIKFPSTSPHQKNELDSVILDVACSSKIGLDKKDIYSLIYTFIYSTGQFPKIKKAKKSVASFKLRKGSESGVFVTLRNSNLYNFLSIFNIIILPQISISSNYPVSIYSKFPKSRNSNWNYGVKELNSININKNVLYYSNNTYNSGTNVQFLFNTQTFYKESLTLLNPKSSSQFKPFQITHYKNQFILSYFSLPIDSN